MKKIIFCYGTIGVICAVFAGAGYTAWNSANPQYTCAQCHEVSDYHKMWKKSAHADVACYECHGTAISNGFHSLTEKVSMVLTHFSKSPESSDIKMTESQVLETSERCMKCHRNEYAKWKSGAHSTTYANIFEDKIHNAAEKPYWECFRCHGMFYDGNINTLMNLDGKPDDWKIKDRAQCARPSIPCLACHEIHSEKPRAGAFENYRVSKTPACAVPKSALYARIDGKHLRSDCLVPLKIYLDGKELKNSDDPSHKLCQQCHSPDWSHKVGTSDDRTPAGAHAGMSCAVCHDPHSGSAADSCAKCHDTNVEKYKFKKGKCPQFLK